MSHMSLFSREISRDGRDGSESEPFRLGPGVTDDAAADRQLVHGHLHRVGGNFLPAAHREGDQYSRYVC